MSLAQKDAKLRSQHFIKYIPEFKGFFRSEKAVLIFEKLEYWSSKYPSGFWKFFESCAHHPQYREGDSWEEELGFSRRVFLKAFSIIGTHYKSKSEYLAQSDPFHGKMYVSYYDRKTNRTHFFRNHSIVEQFLTSFWQGAKKVAQSITTNMKKCRSGNDTNGRSFAYAYKDNISLQRSTSSLKPDPQPSLLPSPNPTEAPPKDKKDENIKIVQDMLGIWNNITQNQDSLKSHLKTKLPQALETSFQGSLDVWKAFCLKVASSKFLMGEAPHSKFKAYLAWLIKPETVQAIEEGYYSLGDRAVYQAEKAAAEAFEKEKIEGSETWKEVCKRLSDRLGYATFKSWFKDLQFLNEDTSYPILQCSSRFKQDWLQRHYQADIEAIVKQLLPHMTRLEIRGGIS